MLDGARRVIGHAQGRDVRARRQPRRLQHLADIPGQGRYPGGAVGIGGVVTQEKPVILHMGAAARGGDNDGFQPGLDLAHPGIHVAPGRLAGRSGLAHMGGERATAFLALGELDPVAAPLEQPRRGGADLRAQHRLGASLQQHHPPARGRGIAGPGLGPCRRGERPSRGELEHGGGGA
jgi:hypothetical protein